MLPNERKLIVATIQRKNRKNNWHYLSRHPEIRAFTRMILKEVIEKAPEDVYDFIANLFASSNFDSLVEMVNEQMEILKKLNKDDEWTSYEGEMFFKDNEDAEDAEQSRGADITKFLNFSRVLSDDDEVIPSVNVEKTGSRKFYVLED